MAKRNYYSYYRDFHINVPMRRRRETLNGGFTTEPDGYAVWVVRLEVDVDTLAIDLGRKAVGAKSKRARGLHGGVVVKAVRMLDRYSESGVKLGLGTVLADVGGDRG